jgi:hypothetical protein
MTTFAEITKGRKVYLEDEAGRVYLRDGRLRVYRVYSTKGLGPTAWRQIGSVQRLPKRGYVERRKVESARVAGNMVRRQDRKFVGSMDDETDNRS